jgi:hypothetical protein
MIINSLFARQKKKWTLNRETDKLILTKDVNMKRDMPR